MADIVDKQIKRYLTSFIRPSSNNLVGISAAIDIELQTWFDTITGLLAPYADDDVVLDDSAADGTAPMSKRAITDYITQILAIQTLLAQAGVMPIVSRPHSDIKLP